MRIALNQFWECSLWKIKNSIVIVTIFFFFQNLNAQVISVSPVFPTDQDTITIIYNAAEGNAALLNANPPIFAHTGVITSKSNNGSDWRYVQGNWGTVDSKVLMNPLGNNLFQIKFHLRSFYNVPPLETIQKLAFVFRNSNGSLVGRDQTGGDIFYTVYESSSALQAILIKPAVPYVFVNLNEVVDIQFECSKISDIHLFINNIESDVFTGKSYKKSISANQTGQFDVRIECVSGMEKIEKSFRFLVGIKSKTENPPAGTEAGVKVLTALSARFALKAPGKKHVFVLGDFNQFQPDTSYLMKQNTGSDLFWLDVIPLKPGFNHSYQFLIDGKILVADPLSKLVLDPFNDSGIPNSSYPDIPKYPAGQTHGIVSVFTTTPIEYQWNSTNYKKPKKDELLIYELLIRDFSNQHSFRSVIDSLDYLARLGINAIELMPINEFEGNISWGYNVSYPMALDKYYGTLNTFKELVDKAHQLGIAVILDVVFNHVFGQSPLAQMYWNAIQNKPLANSPYLNSDATHPFNVGYDMNHESPFTKDYVKQVLKYWLQECKVDGFRFDLSKGFTQQNSGSDVNLWGKYDASRINILKNYSDYIWTIDKEAYVIMEHFAENSEEKELADYGMLLWGNLNYNFNQAAMAYSSNDLNGAFALNRGWLNNHLIAYMESHDEERLMYRSLQYGNVSGTYNIKQLSTALKRQELAFLFYLMIPGPKMIWQFSELGYDYSINFCQNGTINSNCRTDPKPVRWDYLNTIERKNIYELISKLQEFKSVTGLLKNGSLESFIGEGFIKRMKYSTPEFNVVVIGNFDVISRTATSDFQHIGWWFDYLSNDSIFIDNINKSHILSPGEFHLWVDKKVSVDVIDALAVEPKFIFYPNPFTGPAILETDSEIKEIHLFDLLGKPLPLYSKSLSKHSWELNLNDLLPNGIYFLEIVSADGQIQWLNIQKSCD
ncbi:MAG: T9SS type A sorting domain-containing protein [Saprospiraceae bacterium]|nr:T9SS type A sorting domain-containing protein [Saprospiraceae bacterium]